ncbi:MAG: ribose 5-phosphate isomerase B [Salibacteraceae bacterium]
MRIAIGSDHAGFDLKSEIIKHLELKGIQVKDFGPFSDDRVDYPDYAHLVSNSIENKENELGILICGSGNGINMSANKHAGIRSALCWEPEIAALARQHNNANVLALPARFISNDLALKIVDEYLNNSFEGGRHQGRVQKISC